MTAATPIPAGDTLPTTLIALMKGVVEREVSPDTWQDLMRSASQVRDYVGVIGLELMLDEGEGFAYLRQRPEVEGVPSLPRLMPRRQLSYPVSLLLALLRRRMAEADAQAGDAKLVLKRGEIHDLVRHFSQGATNEARKADRLDKDVGRLVELGFLRPIGRDSDTFEVRRILKAFIDAQWLTEFDQKLAAYAGSSSPPEEPAELG